MVALVYKILSAGVLAYVAYIVLYYINQKAIANLLKPILVVYIASLLLPPLARLGNDVQEVRNEVSGLTSAINSLSETKNSIEEYQYSITNSTIANYGAIPKLQGKTFKEKLFGGGKVSYPVTGEITQLYNPPEHHGLDQKGNEGDPVKVIRDGEIYEVVANHKIYGNYILVNHEPPFQSLYAHLSEINVKKGQNVWEGNVIGKVGNTGKSTGSHLHWEIRYTGKTVDPMKYLKE